MLLSVCLATADAILFYFFASLVSFSDVLSDLLLLPLPLPLPLPRSPPAQRQVNVTVDYIRAATGPAEGTPAFSERTCATVTIGGM